MQFFFAPVITLKFYVIPFTKIRVARKTSVSTTHCRLNEFDAANRTFWVWYKITRTINETRPRLIIKYLANLLKFHFLNSLTYFNNFFKNSFC